MADGEVIIKKSVSVWIILGVILLSFLCLGILISSIFPRGIKVQDVTPEVEIIAAPTSTPSNVGGNSGLSQTPTQVVEINGIKAGIYIQVIGTGGAGLRLRSTPGKNGDTNSIAAEDEVFLVVDGPQAADGTTWWKLEAPYQAERGGWASADYLSPIVTPTP
jgi:hypothetical protein